MAIIVASSVIASLGGLYSAGPHLISIFSLQQPELLTTFVFESHSHARTVKDIFRSSSSHVMIALNPLLLAAGSSFTNQEVELVPLDWIGS
jgi:hypothetical protein